MSLAWKREITRCVHTKRIIIGLDRAEFFVAIFGTKAGFRSVIRHDRQSLRIASTVLSDRRENASRFLMMIEKETFATGAREPVFR